MGKCFSCVTSQPQPAQSEIVESDPLEKINEGWYSIPLFFWGGGEELKPSL